MLMNSPLVEKVAQRIAKRLLAEFDTEKHRITELYRVVVSRDPTDDEVNAIQYHLQSSAETDNTERLKTWTGLCRVVLSSNEFLYLE